MSSLALLARSSVGEETCPTDVSQLYFDGKAYRALTPRLSCLESTKSPDQRALARLDAL